MCQQKYSCIVSVCFIVSLAVNHAGTERGTENKHSVDDYNTQPEQSQTNDRKDITRKQKYWLQS